MENKIILVTGGSGLLGSAIVHHLKSKGHSPINLDINVSEDLSSGTIYCDVTNDESIKHAVSIIVDYFGRIDGLVNNAYPRTTDWGTPFENISAESWRKNVDWQLNSSFIFCQEVLPVMQKRRSGAIVNIASIYGVVGNDFTIYENTNIVPPAAYSAIKGGLVNFTRYLASLYGKFGIRINCLSPGGIFNGQPEAFVAAYQRKVPLRRMGNPEDIAPAAAFLLSDEARYITGHNLLVDGGWTAI
jgi:NAD(P)-dependent dehydrogenase (short-subunit alcohol dehydrogenase family)